MALNSSDYARLQNLRSLISGCERKLLSLENESNREVTKMNGYIRQFNALCNKR